MILLSLAIGVLCFVLGFLLGKTKETRAEVKQVFVDVTEAIQQPFKKKIKLIRKKEPAPYQKEQVEAIERGKPLERHHVFFKE